MSVEIEPLELSFRCPFTVEVSRTLKIRNTSSSPLAFKVKTTAPKQYCVRPNAGRIEPGQEFDVMVLLQAMKADPPLDARCRDKFLVQSAPITPDKEFASIATVLDSTDKSIVQEKKIRVNWLPATGDAGQGASPGAEAVTPNKKSLLNGANDTPDASHTYSSPGAHADAVAFSAPPPYSSDTNDNDDDDKSERPKSAVSQAATSISNTAQVTYEELKAKLSQAEAQIANLSGGGLRQRNVKGGAAAEKRSAGDVAQAVKHPDGVSVQVVALLCILSFLLAYFFF